MIKSILRVTPYKRPTIKEILSHPYFTKLEDSVSTKESEFEHFKQNKSPIKIPEQNHPTMNKPQQKSYPFYVPTNTNTPNLNYNPETGVKNMGFNTTISGSISPFSTKVKKGLNPNQMPKQNMNTSFGNFSSMHYRNS